MTTILIVDDREICREFLVKLLGYHHHTILQASDGAEALQIMINKHPQLIITDLLMPTMNGYEFVQKIKSYPELAKIPIIFYTASFLMDEAKLLAESCGVSTVLFKPSDPQVILETVNNILGINGNESIEQKQRVNATELDKPDPVKTEPATAKIETKHLNNSPHENPFTNAGDTPEIFDEAYNFETAMPQQARPDASLRELTADEVNQIRNQLIEMYELSSTLLAEYSPENLLKVFSDTSRQIIMSKYCFIGILDEKNAQLKSITISSVNKKLEKVIDTLPPDSNLVKQILETKGAFRLNTAAERNEVNHRYYDSIMNNFIGVRLITPTHLYGYIYYYDKIDSSTFTKSDLQIISALATQFALIYENIDRYATIQRHATKLQISVNEKAKVTQKKMNLKLPH